MNDKDNTISKISTSRLDVPLIKPYKLSYNTFHSFRYDKKDEINLLDSILKGY